MRELIYVPIVHTAVDMGSLLPHARAEFLKKYGRRRWEEHNRMIQSFWHGLQQRMSSLSLDYAHTHLYQDGLPHCGRELDIVRTLAERNSPNHQLLLTLIERGANLVGTEDPQALREEYELMRGAYGASENQPRQSAIASY